jgi:tetratricopeptide (TPR) repeat protein
MAVSLLLYMAVSQVLFATGPSNAAPPSQQQIERLIEALGDVNYFVRQKAESELGKIGFEAVEALTKATRHDDVEIALRADRLLCLIRSNWGLAGDPSRVRQLLADYESQDDNSRQTRIVSLIDLADNQGIPAVCRIIRYERSLVVAKAAALRLLETKAGEVAGPDLAAVLPQRSILTPLLGLDSITKTDVAAMLRKGLGPCHRAPSRWVLGWLQTRQDPKALAGLWTQLVSEEESLLFRQPRDTSSAIIESLLRFRVASLRKIDRSADAVDSVERLIRLHRGDSSELFRLLDWLIDQKDWPATRLMENRCKATIAESAELLYLVAEAQARRGDAAIAEQSAGQALRLNPASDEASLAMHFQAGENLEQRGRLDWATKEWEHVIHSATPQSPVGIVVARRLAELYHDLGDEQRAAETLGRIEKALARRSSQWPLMSQDHTEMGTLGTLRARMYYFSACHWKVQGNRTKQRECLDKALATQCYDIEVLIECYQISDSTASYHARVRELIDKRLCELREQAADFGPHSAAAEPCNEFAWLVANTEGDLNEALQFSKRSLELVGDNGAFCDTLARVYAAKGEYENAWKYQSRAAEKLPFNRAIQKQLALFRKKLDEKNGKDTKAKQAEKGSGNG